MTLRLVHPAPTGNSSPRRRCERSTALSLTAEERPHFVAALRGLRRAFGTWGALATALQVRTNTLESAATMDCKGGLALAVRVAQLAGIPVEAMLKGTIVEAGTCPTCGARVGDRPGSGGGR